MTYQSLHDHRISGTSLIIQIRLDAGDTVEPAYSVSILGNLLQLNSPYTATTIFPSAITREIRSVKRCGSKTLHTPINAAPSVFSIVRIILERGRSGSNTRTGLPRGSVIPFRKPDDGTEPTIRDAANQETSHFVLFFSGTRGLCICA